MGQDTRFLLRFDSKAERDRAAKRPESWRLISKMGNDALIGWLPVRISDFSPLHHEVDELLTWEHLQAHLGDPLAAHNDPRGILVYSDIVETEYASYPAALKELLPHADPSSGHGPFWVTREHDSRLAVSERMHGPRKKRLTDGEIALEEVLKALQLISLAYDTRKNQQVFHETAAHEVALQQWLDEQPPKKKSPAQVKKLTAKYPGKPPPQPVKTENFVLSLWLACRTDDHATFKRLVGLARKWKGLTTPTERFLSNSIDDLFVLATRRLT